MSSARTATLIALALLVPIALPLVPTTLAAAVSPPVADFTVLAHPSSAGSGAGEPTLGMNPRTGAVLFQDFATTWKVDLATNTWTDVTAPNSITNIDPMLFTDLGTGRTLAGGLDGECSIMSFTDDDGETWTPVANQCAGAWDHQTVGQGAWLEPRPPQATNDRATYYCAQGWINWPTNACVVSWDGGIAYSPPINWAGPCFGLHGHVNVSVDGRAYVPTRSCDGVAGYAWTEDNGMSWDSKQHPAGMAAPGNGFDSSIGTSSDGDTLYFAFESNGWVPMVSRSADDGANWNTPVAVGQDAGIKTATFLRVMSGDPDRVALAYLGSTTDGNPFSSGWAGVWDLYISFSYDAGQTWSTVKATQDPVQRGWMCSQGLSCSAGRNLLDFMGHTLTPQGKVLVGFADGCIGACAGSRGTPSQSTSDWSTIAYQTTGRGLFAAYDQASVDLADPLAGLAGAPTALSASVTASPPYTATVAWGDGSVESFAGQTTPSFTATHVYAEAGRYPVTLTVTGSDGASASDTGEATIGASTGGAIAITSPAEGARVGDVVSVSGIVESNGNLPPTAAFDFTVAGREVAFDAAASADPEGAALAFLWSFGDDTEGSGVAPSHTYASQGTYEACVTVSDGMASDTLCRSVTIAGSTSTVTTDPEGDATNPITGSGSIDELDILKIDMSTSAAGEPVFAITYKTMDAPDPHLADGGMGAQWSVQWQNPSGGTDYVSLDAGATGHVCGWGFFNPATGFLEGQGDAPCTVTPGTPGKITLTFPASGMSARGYVGGDLLTSITGLTGLWFGTPTDLPVYGGSTQNADTTEITGEYTLGAANIPFSKLGIPTAHATKPAPTSPPADPHVSDNVADPIGDTVPTTNIQAAWFDSDAQNLYVGLKVQDIPADPTSTAFIYYAVNFKPTYETLDPTWGGTVSGTFTGLRAFALYSPVRGSLVPAGVSSDTATVFELHGLSTTATGNTFGSIATVTGSIDATTDIVWWTIPRTVLQDPSGNDQLEATSAASAPAIGGVVTFGGILADTTGTGENYVFPQLEVTPPVVSLSASPSTGAAPLDVTFSASVTPNSVSTWTMEFGDGQTATGASTLPASFSHVYDAAGAYLARLTVVAPDGGQGVAQASIAVDADEVPTLSVVVEAAGAAPVQATCAAGCSTWTAELDLSALAPGDVLVTATLLRNGEALSEDAVSVDLVRATGVDISSPLDGTVMLAGDLEVSGYLATATNLAPTAQLAADRDQGVAPLDVRFTLGGDDDKGVSSWRFTTGDGRVVDGVALPATVDHTYQSVGTYTATLTLRDADGATDSASGMVRVQAANSPPTAPTSPAPVNAAQDVALPVALSWTASDADGNALTYDVYINETLAATDQATSSYMPAGLTTSTTYTWRVVAKDGTDTTSGPVWTFTTAAPKLSEAEKPQVVVALIDSGTNPYHQEFRRPELVDHPSTYLTGFPTAGVVQVDLCFYDPVTRTVAQSACPTSAATAAAEDVAEWQQFSVSPTTATGAGQGTIAWFPGTNVLLVSFNHAGDARYPGLDGALGAGDGHGTWTSSNVGGRTTGTCPECIFVMIEGDSVAGIEAAYQWAANQPWIDVITSSVSIGLIGLGANPADFFDATSAATQSAVQNGKIVFEAAGNGVANFGLAPTSTFLYANSNPWTIPVGCSAEHTGQPCGYHDFPNAVTASGVARQSADINTFSGTTDVGGTSFLSPSTAGVTARALFAARAALNDLEEGPSAGDGSLLRVGSGAAAPAVGPFANGKLSKLELEEALFKTARRGVLPEVPTYLTPNSEIPNTPLGFVKEGFGNVYRGDWGVGHPTNLSTWSSSAEVAAVLLGQKPLPNRWFEEQWWEQIVTPAQAFVFGADVAEPAADNADGFPRDDPQDPTTFLGYSGPSASGTVPTGFTASATPPIGTVPTPSANRLYLHHNDLGPDPSSVSGNSVYEKYLNTIADPSVGATCPGAGCPDRSGVGATGVNPTGSFTSTYTLMHPYLGTTLTLDRTKDVVIHIAATNYAGAGASPLAMNVQLLSNGAPIGGASAPRVLDGTGAYYEARFKPAADALSDTVELVVSWPGPIYSSHIQTRGKSWIDLPIQATLPPVDYETITYYVDDFDATYGTNGDTVTLTRDSSRLVGDANAGFTFAAPQQKGAVINLAADDTLASGPMLLGTAGSARVYPCTFPVGNAGAAVVTVKVALRVGSTPIGEGSLTTTLAGLHTGSTAGIAVPIAMHPVIVPQGAPLEGSIVMHGPGGVFAANMGVCGGSDAQPISITLSALDLTAIPTATIAEIVGSLEGVETLSGTATFPVVPGVAETTWYATNAGDWDVNGETLVMDTSAPGTSSATFFEPTPGGVTVSFRSARPAAADLAAIALDGVATAQFWMSPIGGAQDVTVDLDVFLESASGTRELGSASVTKSVPVDALGLNPWPDGPFQFSFVPLVATPAADEHVVMRFNIHNVGGRALTSNVVFFGGDAAQPIYLSLPKDADTTPTETSVLVELGELRQSVPVVGDAWTLEVDSRTLANGAYTLSVTPTADYGGELRTGVPAEASVDV